MILSKMSLKKILQVVIAIICLVSCRYKDNDKLIIATVKQRIEKTWYLKEYIVNGNYINPNNTLTLKIQIPSKKLINLQFNNGDNIQFLFDSKTIIKYKDDATGRELKITKLTRDELWLSGDQLFSSLIMIGSNDKVQFKFSSKP